MEIVIGLAIVVVVGWFIYTRYQASKDNTSGGTGGSGGRGDGRDTQEH